MLLRIHFQHHGAHFFQAVPDGSNGDLGIEGFATDGTVYQCYCPQGDLSVEGRYAKHRDKMTEDLGKFTANQKQFREMLDAVKVRAWVFVIPRNDSKNLVLHAGRKTDEIRKKQLSYCTEDFRVLVHTDEDYPRAREFVTGMPDYFRLPVADIDPGTLDGWSEGNDKHVATIDEKLSRVRPALSNARQRQSRENLLRNHLISEDTLNSLRENFPDVWESLLYAKAGFEKGLEARCLLERVAVPEVIDEFLAELVQRFPHIDKSSLRMIALGSIADWLIRCPLDFPEVEVNG